MHGTTAAVHSLLPPSSWQAHSHIITHCQDPLPALDPSGQMLGLPLPTPCLKLVVLLEKVREQEQKVATIKVIREGEEYIELLSSNCQDRPFPFTVHISSSA